MKSPAITLKDVRDGYGQEPPDAEDMMPDSVTTHPVAILTIVIHYDAVPSDEILEEITDVAISQGKVVQATLDIPKPSRRNLLV